MKIGTVVKLKLDCLGNECGALGVVYESYPDFDIIEANAVSVIFENGNYDGFSDRDQRLFLERVDFSGEHSNYQFKHVIKVSEDFGNGYWDKIFKK